MALLITDPAPSKIVGLFQAMVPTLIIWPPSRKSLPLNVPPLHCTTFLIIPPLQFNEPDTVTGLPEIVPPLMVIADGVIAALPLNVAVPPDTTNSVVIG